MFVLRWRQRVQMCDDLRRLHHVGIFVVQVEKIDLVAEHGAVIGAFLDQDRMEAVGIGVDGAGANAARCALAADDQAFSAQLAQMGDERRAEKGRCPFLVDDQIPRLRRNLFLDVVDVVSLLGAISIGRVHAAGVDMPRRINDWHAGAARSGEQILRRLEQPSRRSRRKTPESCD